jgi:hypothetical protein
MGLVLKISDHKRRKRKQRHERMLSWAYSLYQRDPKAFERLIRELHAKHKKVESVTDAS